MLAFGSACGQVVVEFSRGSVVIREDGRAKIICDTCSTECQSDDPSLIRAAIEHVL